MEQPVRQDRLAAGRPRRAEAFEQRPGPEQVEVGGVRVVLVEEPRPGRTPPSPASFDARDPFFVESGAPFGPPTPGHHSPVRDH